MPKGLALLEQLTFFAPVLALCVILVGMHAYLGLHVLARGVIFIDLSLAQVAALGGLLAQVFWHEASRTLSYVSALGATLLAASLLTLATRRAARISMEALIGILFAGASAGSILLLDQLDHGTDHLKHALVGNILFVTWKDVFQTLGIYSLVGVLLFAWDKRLRAQSLGQTQVAYVDFVFYVLFSVVIVSSVTLSGVLVVFAFLIGPTFTASLVCTSWNKRLLFAWALGVILSLTSLLMSIAWDLPTGATLVAVFSTVAFAAGLLVPKYARSNS